MTAGSKKRSGRRWIGVVFGALLAAPALAADFTIDVGVSLHRVHRDVRDAQLYCYVFDRANATGDFIIASARVRIPLDAGGDYDGSLRAAMDARPGKSPEAANEYTCRVLFDGEHVPHRSTDPRYRARPGTSPRLTVFGAIPSSAR